MAAALECCDPSFPLFGQDGALSIRGGANHQRPAVMLLREQAADQCTALPENSVLAQQRDDSKLFETMLMVETCFYPFNYFE
jgi:hypothetical protein